MMQRRDFLRATVVLAGVLVGPGCADIPEARLEDGSAFFPQSVASGDPRPESVILWTRVEDGERAAGDVPLELQVATREDFAEIHASARVAAPARHDHCAKVKVTGLAPATTYYYRFIYRRGQIRYVSRTGRTRTAPPPEADAAVRFAFISCQDYSAGYFNALLLLAREELDFVVHLGDYIYETTPGAEGAARRVAFTDVEGALRIERDGEEVLAAASLDNYRELYRTYRSDPALQAVHERFPVIAIWDDHEFSNDGYNATGTYFNERVDEEDVARRKNANQAWFEYQPVDYGDAGFEVDRGAPFPGDLPIHRDLVFGRHVHLVLTDLRTYRPDHLVPESALPGEVAVTQAELMEIAGSAPGWASTYVDIDTHEGGIYRSALIEAAPLVGYDPGRIRGNIAVPYINQVLEALNATRPAPDQVPYIQPSTQHKSGVSFLDMGKLAPYAALGARTLVGAEAFNLYAAKRYLETNGRSEQVMGTVQESWFLVTLRRSPATWKVWANAYAFSPLVLDLGSATELPEPLRRRYHLSADAWDGFPNRRRWLLRELAAIEGVVILSGDAHALFASTPAPERDPWDDELAQEVPAARVVEIVGPAVSAAPLGSTLSGPELSAIPGAAEVLERLEELLTSPELRANPHLALARTMVHGYVTVEADGEALTATARLLDLRESEMDLAGQVEALAARVETIRLRTRAGTGALEREAGAGWERWSPELVAWVPAPM